MVVWREYLNNPDPTTIFEEEKESVRVEVF